MESWFRVFVFCLRRGLRGFQDFCLQAGLGTFIFEGGFERILPDRPFRPMFAILASGTTVLLTMANDYRNVFAISFGDDMSAITEAYFE